ncbi:trimeric intracellular cation channel family protein [Synoicihabitans lomoniglobus]|uniref:TRIC cation channel family protein n=1 Tax=Synoicihabitans lomoniglobus TaxID=2909285 RepID=A0AAF0A0Q7_9BACT|nr:TRIC cation channel family protein [Opitutaceae bacterium LMO-M01]WED64402.1 TRIC cation channel family protein [Opitutaceae bacterium LMO-M01]
MALSASVTNPFFLPIWFELGAVGLMSMTGAIVAIKRGYDVVGLASLSLLVGLGGSLIRDGIFLQQGPPAALANPLYIEMALFGGAVGALLGERVHYFRRIIAGVDALALGAYAAYGVQKALGADISIPAAIVVGVVNALGGGLLRDVITNEEPLVFRPGQFYALVALAAATLFVVLTVQLHLRPTVSAGWVIAATFVFRVMTILFNWKTAPLAPPTAAPPSI